MNDTMTREQEEELMAEDIDDNLLVSQSLKSSRMKNRNSSPITLQGIEKRTDAIKEHSSSDTSPSNEGITARR